MFRIICSLAFLTLGLLAGCEDLAAPPEPAVPEPAAIGSDFDPANTGDLRGQVIWDGAIPAIASYRAPVNPGSEHQGDPRREWKNPNAPRIDAATKGVADAVLFLREVPLDKSRPWDHAPVRIELRDYQIHICQGERDGNSGFVRRGEVVTMLSRQELYHSLRARGADFFARAFPDVEQPRTRRFGRAGIVELSSGCGYFWMRGRLFVVEHPYYTRSDAKGRFTLPQVPPGRYDLVCWLPDWHEAFRELDAETGLICRLTFRPAIEITQSIRVEAKQTGTVSIPVPAARFAPR